LCGDKEGEERRPKPDARSHRRRLT
jgi:hypothetical protein